MSERRVAVVTGAASGIGLATTVRLAGGGDVVVAVDLDEDGLARAEAAAGDAGGKAVRFPVDLRDRAGVEALVRETVERFGRLDVVVNNAGIGVAAPVAETSDEDWDAILDVNLTAVFTVCRAALPPMLRAGRGVFVNVSSVAGVVGVRNRAAYCASKSAVLGLTRALAVDYADRGIRANAICPGTVATEWIGKILADADDPAATRKAMEARQLDGRMGSPEEVAAGIAFLASDEARFVNGSAFVMDGGMTAV